jgi:hypothetical protein
MLAAILVTGGTSLKSATLDGAEWMAVLERLAAALPSEGPPLRLCLIGSAACLFGGMEGRTSRDLDIWKPASRYRPDLECVRRIVAAFERRARERASENLIYLDVLQD